jgi:ubiquinone/menaquinone biosynthesis C-methylase UbiE
VIFAWAILALVVVGLFLYWLFIIAEATYLGPWAVAWTYDLVARHYDRIKQFNPQDESWYVAGPILRDLHGVERPLVLDVATGTGRVPVALLREGAGRWGAILGLDLSWGMLHRARAKLGQYGNVILVRYDARHLPFDDDTFDAVTCMESLEFMPRPLDVLAEMVRVLAPGGTLLVTNRVGREAQLLPRRAISRPGFREALAALPLEQIDVRRWQVNYDLAAARKTGSRPVGPDGQQTAASILRCPGCGGALDQVTGGLACRLCRQLYPARDGVVDLAGSMEKEVL